MNQEVETSEDKNVFDRGVCFKAHEKGVASISLASSGTKLCTGSRNGCVRLWDMHGMSKRIRHFREFFPHESHPIDSVQLDSTGNRVLVTSGDAICRIVDSDGVVLVRTYQGDMYVRDTKATKGHTHAVHDAAWHPLDGNVFASASADCTVRIWDSTSKPEGIDDAITQAVVLKALDSRGTNMSQTCGVCRLAFAPITGNFIIGGCADGSVQLWNRGKSSVSTLQWREPKPAKIARNAHQNEPVMGLVIDEDEISVLTRSESVCNVWDLRKFKEPVSSIRVPTKSLAPDVQLLPGTKKLIILPTFTGEVTSLKIYELATMGLVQEMILPDGFGDALCLETQKESYQAFIGGAQGSVFVALNDSLSTNGGMLITPEALAFESAPATGVPNPELLTTPAFNYYELPSNIKETKDGRLAVVKPRRLDLRQRQMPQDLRSLADPVMKHTASQKFMAQFLEEEEANRAQRRAERELEKEVPNISLVQAAYAKTQPVPILSESPWDESADYMGHHDKCPRCGLRMCSCGYMELQKGRDEALNQAAKRQRKT